jgi:hypothetical protein
LRSADHTVTSCWIARANPEMVPQATPVPPCANDVDGWVEAHMKVAEKWDGRMGMVGQEPGDWKERARRAEARAEAEKMIAGANVYIAQARVNEARRPSYWLHALMRKIRRRVKVSF